MGKNEKKEVRRTEEGFYICDKCGGYFEEHEMSRGRYGVIGICKTCVGKAHKEGALRREEKKRALEQELKDLRIEVADLKRQIKESVGNALSKATPRDLMRELHNRGYNGELEYTKVTKVDISKLED